MQKQRKNRYADVSRQAARMRALYSQIGEPLPADVLIDLYRHLGKALDCAGEGAMASLPPKGKNCRKAN